jgi:hypothetical protein
LNFWKIIPLVFVFSSLRLWMFESCCLPLAPTAHVPSEKELFEGKLEKLFHSRLCTRREGKKSLPSLNSIIFSEELKICVSPRAESVAKVAVVKVRECFGWRVLRKAKKIQILRSFPLLPLSPSFLGSHEILIYGSGPGGRSE